MSCYCCGKVGHIAKNCFLRNKAECRKCGKKGHLDVTCRSQSTEKTAVQMPNSQSLHSVHLSSGSKVVSKDKVLIDSGCTDHILTDRKFFQNLREITSSVKNPDGSFCKIEGIGDVEVELRNENGSTDTLIMRDVLFVPSYETNLVSVSKLVEKGHRVEFSSNCSQLKTEKGANYGIDREGSLYTIQMKLVEKPLSFATHAKKMTDLETWHKRLCHANERSTRLTVPSLKKCEFFCETCALSKIHERPVPREAGSKASKKLERVYTDIMGPIEPASINGYRYAITFIDEFTKYAVVKFMKFKSEALEKLKQYVAEEGVPEKLRSDNAKEYKSQSFEKFCVENKIKREFTVPETPQQNGVAERYNRTLAEMTRCNLIEGKLSKMYWVRAMATANYTLNCITNEKTKKSPFELFFGKKPDLTKLRVFGCIVFMQKRKQQRSKLEPRGVKCKFLGYDDCSPSYVVQEIDSGQIHFARNTIFNENEIPSSDFSGDSVVRSDDGSIIDIFEKIAEKKANENSTNQENVETTNLRTYAQEEEQSDEVESLVNDQALFAHDEVNVHCSPAKKVFFPR